jgi:OmcA/MtrC family decaheme c-type cytochrome
MQKITPVLALAAGLAAATGHAQTLAWDAAKYFKYNIENVVVAPAPAPAPTGSFNVKVIFSVTNPVSGAPWDIKAAAPFTAAGANLTLDIGWDAAEFSNTGSANAALTPVATSTLGTAAALVAQVRGIQTAGVPCASATDCPGVPSLTNRYAVTRLITPQKFVKLPAIASVAIEGRPVCAGLAECAAFPPGPPFVNIPVTSQMAAFKLTASNAALVTNPRRKIVDIAKCHACHDDRDHGTGVVPKLSLHGGNRNENLTVCVTCHNPNQTDVAYRYTPLTPDADVSGAEQPINFTYMVHAIHSGGFRGKRYAVIGFNSSVNDFSGVRFPKKLRDCTNCHVNTATGKGTYELPLAAGVLGTTVKTQSNYLAALGAGRTVDVNPANDLKISPTAAACSACHAKDEVRSHMIRTGGASFSTTQAAIGVTVIEKCARCHGPGQEEDVKRAHEIGGSHGD